MGKINIGRVILGGIVAGIVADALGYFVDDVMLATRWSGELSLLGHVEFSSDQLILFNILGLIGGIATIWLYAAIRPRFGAGALTAIYAGVASWFIGVLLPNLSFMWAAGLFSKHLTLYTTAGAFFEVVLGAIAGAALYQESAK
jgi:hypothetical protein